MKTPAMEQSPEELRKELSVISAFEGGQPR